MPPLPSTFEIVPIGEVAGVLAEAAIRGRGGPAGMITAAGIHLANALLNAGYRVVRVEPGVQLTL